jgi:hypothetical protein
MEERELDLLELLQRILLSWRAIVVWVLICAVACGAFAYFKVGQSVALEKQAMVDEELKAELEAEELAEIEENLSAREMEEARAAVESYKSYFESYQNILNYMTDSVKMSLDPNALPSLTVQYLVDNHYEAVYPVIDKKDQTADIINTFSARLLDESVCTKLQTALGWDTDIAYIRELIDAYTSASDILTISIIGPDQESCEIIADVLEEECASIAAQLQDVYGAFDMTRLNRKYMEVVSTSLLSAQQSQASALNSVKGSLTGITSGLSDDQKQYYSAILDKEMEAYLPEEVEEPEISVVEILKYIILGILLGGFLSCAWIACKWIFAGTILSTGDIEAAFPAPVFGQIEYTAGKKAFLPGIDRWIRGMFEHKGAQFSEEERLRMITSGIRIAAEKKAVKKVYLTGSVHGDVVEQTKKTICEKLAGQGLEIAYGNSPICDPESLENMVASDAVVFVEQVDLSRYEDMKKEVMLCGQHQIPMMGYVVIKEV